MKAQLLFKGLIILVMMFPLISFSQGGTSLTSPGTGISLPFSTAGTTIGKTDNVNDPNPDPLAAIGVSDDGPDWVYMYCPTVTTNLYVTVTFTPGGVATPVLPFVSLYYNNAGTWTFLSGGSVTGDVDQTVGCNYIGIPAGLCVYIVVDGANSGGYNYNINVTSTPLPTQTLTTQPGCTNMGFDNGSLSGWTGNWGHSINTGAVGASTPVYTPIFATTNAGHHTVTSGGLDAFTGAFSQVCPLIPGNTNSLMLGDGANASYGGAQIMQKFNVTAANALFTYYYASVIQDAGVGSGAHENWEQPFFKIDALNCAGTPIACGNLLVTGGPGIPGFTQIGSTGVYYKDWTPIMLDLTPYIGSCVTIKFTVGDCSKGAHFSYSYLDATCGPLQIVATPTACQYTNTTLTAPVGAASYSWVNMASPGTVLSTSNPFTFSPTTTGTATYQCTMTSVTGCSSTVSTTINVLPTPQITVTNPPAVCAPNTVDITSASVVTITSGTGTISYYSDAACTVPIASPGAITASGTYYIKILNGNGCYDVKPVTVVVNPTPTVNVTTADQTICAGQSVNLSSTITPAGINTPVTFTNTTDFNITDFSGTPTVSPITVSGITPQTAGVLPIVSVQINIVHTYDDDLTIRLQCPGGSFIELSSQNGLDGDNYTNTVFVPTGSSITTGTAPFTGSFTPEQAFTLLNSCAVNGTWNLLVYDLASGDVGTILDWSITFNNYVPPTFVWSPTTNMTNSTTLSPTVSPTVTTVYTLTGTSGVGGCSASDPITITVNPLPTATISGTTTVCKNAVSPTITFTGANGTAPYTFTYNINGGANQTVSSGAGSTATVSAPTTTAGTFTYNLVSVSSTGCPNPQAGSAVVTVNPLPTATISGTTTVCQNAAAPNITFTGANGTAPYTFTYNINGGANQTVSSGAGTTATVSVPTSTVGTFTYNLVSVSSANTCSQAQAGSAVVTVNPLPTATISGTTTVCQNAAAPNITFTGANGTAPYTFTYNINGGANQTVSSGAGTTATVSAPTTTVGTFTYNLVSVSISTGCPNLQAGSAVVTVNPLPTATISGTTTVCQNAAAPNITFTGANGTAPYTFTYNINGGANQTVSSGAGSTATVSAPTSTAGTFTYNLVSVSSANTCSQAQAGSAVVTVNPLPTATISGTTTVCQNAAAPNITFTGANGAAPYTFTYNINGGANQTVSSGAGSTATVSVPTSTIGTFTYNLVSVSSTGCPNPQVGSAVVTVNPLPTATISGTTTVCQNSAAPNITFTGANGTAPYTFTYNINGGANQTVSSGAGSTATVSAPTTTTGTFTYNLVSVSISTGCPNLQAGSAVVTVNPLPTATISGTTTVCQNAAAPNITFTGANGTAPYTFTYNINGGANQTVSSGAGSTATVSAPTATIGTFTYNLVSVSSANTCSQAQVGSAVVTINPLPTATISGTTTVCQNAAAPNITFTGANGTAPYTFTYNINGGANQTVSSGAGSTATVSAPTTTVGTFTYNLVSVSIPTGCPNLQAGSAVVTVNPLPTATISGTTTVCQNTAAPNITFTGANGTAPYTFTYNINGGANQTVSSGAGSTATVSAPTSTAGTFTYNLISVSSANTCSQAQAGSAVVTVNPQPTATISGTISVCQNSGNQTVTFTGANGTAPYTFTYTLNGGANQTISSGAGNTATISVSSTTAGTFAYTLVSVSEGLGCSQNQAGTATVTVDPAPTATISGTTSVCQNSTAPNVTLTGANGTAPYTFTYTLNGGGNQTIVSNASGIATISVPITTAGTFSYDLVNVTSAIGCSQAQIGNATVTVLPTPQGTISGTIDVCQNDPSPAVTFTGSNDAPAYTFTYTVNGGANQTISSGAINTATINVLTSTAGTFAYHLIAVQGNNLCTQVLNQTATIVVNPTPTAAISGTTTICDGSSATLTVNGTPGATVSYTDGTTVGSMVLNAAGTGTINTGALSSTTTYTLQSVQSAAPASCSAILNSSVTVTVNPIPVADPTSNLTACVGATVNTPAFTSAPAGATFGWVNSNTSIGLGANGIGNIASFTGTNTGATALSGTITYVPTLNGCIGQAQMFTITIYPLPIANAGANSSACQNSGLIPIGGPTDPNNTYSWSPTTGLTSGVSSNPSAYTVNPGTTNYTLTVTSMQGCINTDDVTVTVFATPQVSITPSTLSGCSPVLVTFTANAPTSVNCVWNIDGFGTVNGCGSVTEEYTVPGQYGASIVVTDANGCTNSAATASFVTVFPDAVASFGVDAISHSTLDPTFRFSNASTNATNYLWEFGDGINSNDFEPTHTYDYAEAVYNVMLVASNEYGCVDTAVLTISVTPELIFYVPNAFTPDGDENNNTFFPVFTEGFDLTTYTMLIFDRWGEIIFETHNVDFGWDGTYHDMMCKDGVYTWKILIKERTIDKHHEYHGHVSLLK